MEEQYKGHLIRSGAYVHPGTNRWMPMVIIFWNEGSNAMRKEPAFDLIFATEQEAQDHAREFAMKWIDNGKPALRTRG